MKKALISSFVMLVVCLIICVSSLTISFAAFKGKTPNSEHGFVIDDFVDENETFISTENYAINKSSEDVYLRAYIYTFWSLTTDGNENSLVAKTEWTMPSNAINTTDWQEVGDFYYLKTILAKDATSSALVYGDNLDLTIEYDDTQAISAVQSYRIIYEILYVYDEEDGSSCEDAWGVTISNGTVTAVN